MTEIEYSRASEATTLCKACGLCCTGHLFSWVRLKAVELTPLEKLGLNVIRSDPRQRGVTQPCPMANARSINLSITRVAAIPIVVNYLGNFLMRVFRFQKR